ncbi:MAG: hypothetical protein CM1200mP27_01230 [Chloroflexota bacterium]|nr:MAG: hypothetical protein CM1200mP27_01230 [Chloroflexota bacterium]
MNVRPSQIGLTHTLPWCTRQKGEGCEEINKEISEATGVTERLVLYSTREYKKTRVRYFVPDYDDYLDTEQPDAVITA